jgi:hypothetical protein
LENCPKLKKIYLKKIFNKGVLKVTINDKLYVCDGKPNFEIELSSSHKVNIEMYIKPSMNFGKRSRRRSRRSPKIKKNKPYLLKKSKSKSKSKRR